MAVAETLRSYGLAVFFEGLVATGEAIESTIWQALVESHALAVIVPEDAPGSWMAFEIGAARAWNKPVFAVATNSTSRRLPFALQEIETLPISRIDEIVGAIEESRHPMSDKDTKTLSDAYHKTGVPVDQLAQQPNTLAKLVRDFNRRSRKRFSGEQILWHLLRLRKRRALPAVSRKTPNSAK